MPLVVNFSRKISVEEDEYDATHKAFEHANNKVCNGIISLFDIPEVFTLAILFMRDSRNLFYLGA